MSDDVLLGLAPALIEKMSTFKRFTTKGCIYVQNIYLHVNIANVIFQRFRGTKNLPTGKINIGIHYWNTLTQIRKKILLAICCKYSFKFQPQI